jgi:glutamyl-tRNA reductase
MELLTFGLNHQTAPLAVRERVVFHAESLVQALRDLAERQRVKEAAIISTCNRTEIYCNADEPREAGGLARRVSPDAAARARAVSLSLPQEQAVKHAFASRAGSIRWCSASRRSSASSRRR